MSWWFNNENSVKINSDDIKLCVDLIRDIIKNEFKQINRLMLYLESILKVCNELNIGINWYLPHGLEVNKFYLYKHKKRVPLVSYSKQRLTIKYVYKNRLNKSKQNTALMPNLIHYLDATSLMLLCQKFLSINNHGSIFTVHDCFATTCDKVANLLVILRFVYKNSIMKNPFYVSLIKILLII